MTEHPDETGRQRAYEEFVDPGPLPAGADLAGAEARLLGALEHELGVPIAPAPDAGAARPARADSRPDVPDPARGLRGLFAWVTGAGRGRPALALAVVVVLAGGIWTQVGPRRDRGAPLLRGPAGTVAPGAWGAFPLVTPIDDGRTRLEWSPAPQATSYAVTFLGDDLHEIAHVRDLVSTTLVLERDALPVGLRSGQVVLWRVTAHAGRDEVARSATSPLTLP